MKPALSNRRPRHGDQDSALHLLDQRDRLVNRLSPALVAPALLATDLALLEVGKLPQMMDRVEVTDLDEPSSNSFHDFAAGLESSAPVRLPLEQVAWVQRVGAKLEKAAELAGWGGWPEAELLHQRGALALDELLESLVEGGEVGMARDRMQGGVIALVSLVFPDVDYIAILSH